MLTRPIFAENLQHFVHFGLFFPVLSGIQACADAKKIRAQGLNKRAKIL